MAHYVGHGHEPSDDEIARHGYRAFGPHRPAFNPTGDDFARAHRQLATGDADELAGEAERLAGLWPAVMPPYWPWGYYFDDDV